MSDMSVSSDSLGLSTLASSANLSIGEIFICDGEHAPSPVSIVTQYDERTEQTISPVVDIGVTPVSEVAVDAVTDMATPQLPDLDGAVEAGADVKKAERKVRDYSTRKPKDLDGRAKRLLSIMKVIIKRHGDGSAFTTSEMKTILSAPYRNWAKSGKVKSISADISTAISSMGFLVVGKGESVGRGRNPNLFKLSVQNLTLQGKGIYLAAMKELQMEPETFSQDVYDQLAAREGCRERTRERIKKEQSKAADGAE